MHEQSYLALERAPSGMYGRLRRYGVVVDGRRLARLGQGERRTVAVPAGHHTVTATLDWVASEPVPVTLEPGQTVRLRCGTQVHGKELLFLWKYLLPRVAGGAAALYVQLLDT